MDLPVADFHSGLLPPSLVPLDHATTYLVLGTSNPYSSEGPIAGTCCSVSYPGDFDVLAGQPSRLGRWRVLGRVIEKDENLSGRSGVRSRCGHS